MTARWFRRRSDGRGWTPCSWQGWLALAAFLAGVFDVVWETQVLGPERTFEILAALVIAILALTAFTSGRDSDA